MNSKFRIACDTNVLVSAFIAGGPPGRVLEEVLEGKLDLVLLEPTLAELMRILSDKLGFELGELRSVQTLLADIAVDNQPTPTSGVEPISGDPDDDLILACAIDARVDVLVSGDRKHLLPVAEYQGVRIIQPQTLLAELRA